MSKPSFNFFNHTFISFSSTRQKGVAAVFIINEIIAHICMLIQLI